MTLAEYLAEHGVKQIFVARKSGVSINTVHRIVHGKYEPRVCDALKIVEVCHGHVTLADLIPPKKGGAA